MTKYPLLETINYPYELRLLKPEQLHALSRELREFILESVSSTGGHLASSLGCIELTVALHYIYNTPADKIVWDVGHQSYPHKILTGRRTKMPGLRQYNGIAGFPKRDESEYDTFGVGHSSTSISAALGMAVAAKKKGLEQKTVAVIGDGAMTAGLAFEGLNNAGWLDANVLVILNDNEMSISENVGAITRYFAKIISSRFYNSVKEKAHKALDLVPTMRKIAHKFEEHVKGMVMPSTFFEELGFNYIGPIDGHDIEILVETLSKIRDLSGPQFLHIVTKKGQGYKLAENDPIGYHGVTKFNPDAGLTAPKAPPKMSYTQVFGKWLCDLAESEDNFVAITPAMREGSGMVEFAKLYPEKFFDVGIAEQHAITFAAGISTQGVKPIVAIYSTFLQRGYDQLIHDVALQNLPMVFAIDRAGIVGADGPTHIGSFDISFLRCIPDIVIMAPSDENECYQMLSTAYKSNKVVAVRYPRGSGIGAAIVKNPPLIPLGTGEIVVTGQKIALLAFGPILHIAKKVAEVIGATVCNMRFAKPLDENLIAKMCSSHDCIVTLEDNVIAGGAGSAVLETMNKLGFKNEALLIGIEDWFPPHGDPEVIHKLCGLDADSILMKIKEKFNI